MALPANCKSAMHFFCIAPVQNYWRDEVQWILSKQPSWPVESFVLKAAKSSTLMSPMSFPEPKKHKRRRSVLQPPLYFLYYADGWWSDQSTSKLLVSKSGPNGNRWRSKQHGRCMSRAWFRWVRCESLGSQQCDKACDPPELNLKMWILRNDL